MPGRLANAPLLARRSAQREGGDPAQTVTCSASAANACVPITNASVLGANARVRQALSISSLIFHHSSFIITYARRAARETSPRGGVERRNAPGDFFKPAFEKIRKIFPDFSPLFDLLYIRMRAKLYTVAPQAKPCGVVNNLSITSG